MTAKDKAKDLVDSFLKAPFNCTDCDMPYCEIKCTILIESEAKQCALIAVNEIIKELERSAGDYTVSHITDWWQEVKQEIEKL